MTEFTTYIASTDEGLHKTGVWYHGPRGRVFAVASYSGVSFIGKHFFERYAERFISKAVPVKKAAKHFFYKNIFQGLYVGSQVATEERPNQIAVVYEQGVALGSVEAGNNSSLNTFIGNDMLFPRQTELAERIRRESDNGQRKVIFIHRGESQELETIRFTEQDLLNTKNN